MNVIKTILKTQGVDPKKVLFKKGGRRSDIIISDTRHLIKYFLYVHSGFSSPSIERHMRPLSDGFHHSSVLHSVAIIEDQAYIFKEKINEIKRKL